MFWLLDESSKLEEGWLCNSESVVHLAAISLSFVLGLV
jgi:hypothetical protein